MVKVVGAPPHIYIIEESSNEIDWTIVFTRKTSEAAKLKFEQYKNETMVPHVRLIEFNRGLVMLSSSDEPATKKSW